MTLTHFAANKDVYYIGPNGMSSYATDL